MRPRAEKGEATRQGIVAAATKLFARQGYEKTSIEDVLEATGMSRGALYYHFPSKEALFEAVLVGFEAELADAIVSAARGIKDPVDALRAGCDAWLKLAGDNAVRQIVLIDAPAVVGWQKWREIDSKHGFGLLKASLKAAADKGYGRPDLVDVMSQLLLASLIEASLIISRAENTKAALTKGKAAIKELIDRLLAK